MSARLRSKSEVEDSFWSRVVPCGECLLWGGQVRSDGYGTLWVSGGPEYAHRYAYKLRVGDIPAGMHLDHTCRNRSCVNVSHLEVVSCAENLLRGVGFCAVNARKTHCQEGHEFNSENTTIRKDGRRVCRVCRREQRRVGWVKPVEVDPYARTGKVVSR